MRLRLLSLAVVLALAPLASAEDVRLQGAGATFPNIIYQRWVTEYQKIHPEVKIDYQSIGSGGGIKGITEKTVDFGASDAPMNAKEITKAQKDGGVMIQIPTVAGAVVAAYNLPGFAGDLRLDGPTLAAIFMGKITKWNDPQLVALNPGEALPDMSITPVHRTDGSGTTYVFTNYLAGQSQEYKETIGAGKEVAWPSGMQGGKGNEGVTAVTKSTSGALGYIELAFALQNKIPYALLKNKDGQFIKASTATVSAAGEGALEQMTPTSLAVNIWNQSGPDAYPISSFTYLLVYQDLGHNIKDPAKAKALVDFMTWALTGDGQKLAPDLDYAPLAPGVQKKVADAIGSLKCPQN